MKKFYTESAFTLAELLIALAILGIIATFTIPKILDSGSGAKHNSIVKEIAATITTALQQHKLQGNNITTTRLTDLISYINFIRRDSHSNIDYHNNGFDISCSNANPCLVFHNGSIMRYSFTSTFLTSDSSSALSFFVDPDGTYSGSNVGPSKSTLFFLYSNGRLRTIGSIETPTYVNGASVSGPWSHFDPEYLDWSN